jgi:inositol transport system permease protein
LANLVESVGVLTYDKSRRSWPSEVNVLTALVLIVVAFDLIGRIFLHDRFLFNTRRDLHTLFNEQRLQISILQVSITGIIAIPNARPATLSI